MHSCVDLHQAKGAAKVVGVAKLIPSFTEEIHHFRIGQTKQDGNKESCIFQFFEQMACFLIFIPDYRPCKGNVLIKLYNN